MSDQPEPVGFEAYFETKEFEKGMKRFVEAIDKLRGSISSLEHTKNQFADRVQIAFDSIGRSSQQMSQETDRNIRAMSQAMRDGGVLIGQATESVMEESGEKAGKRAGESLLVGLAAATIRGGGIERVGSAIGSALGFAIGNAVAPGVGGTIGALAGGKAFGTTRGAIAGIAGIFGPIGSGLAYLAFLAADTVEFIGKLFSGLGKLIEIALTPVRIVGEFVFNTLATTAASAFGKISEYAQQAFSNIVSEMERMFDAFARLQEIEAGLGALVRSALVVERGYSDARQAMEESIGITSLLTDALAHLALTSPFTMEQINSIFRVNTAFGISLGLSMELTEAMIQFGAATGFGADSLNLIARNLAQIAKFGQVYRRDIYQLANAGVDLGLIVREELNMSIEELNQALQEGTVSMDDLLRAFITFAQTNFAGAAEDLSKTIVGLQNRLETLKTLVVQDFLGPVINQVAAAMDTLFEAFARVLQTGVFESFGETIASILGTIVKDVDWTVENVSISIMEFMLWLARTANTMAQYGFGMMEAWGFGMLEGAFQAISAVVNFISSAITSLFATHSPPKILPMIDVWGAETIQAWLEGMTRADFGIINRVISPIESALRNLGLEQPEILGNLQGVVQQLSRSLRTGVADESLMNFLASITGPFGSAIRDLTRLEFELADAIRQVAEAQESLNQAHQMYSDADEDVRRLVREYNDLLRAGASDDVLDAKLKEIRAAQDQRKEAAQLIKEREEELDIAKENQKEMEETTHTQRDMVDLMIKLTQSTKDMESAAKSAARSMGNAMSQELENLEGGIGDLSNLATGFADELQNRLGELKGQIDAELEDLRTNVEAFIDEVRAFFTDEDGSFAEFLDTLGDLQEAFENVGGVIGIAEQILLEWDKFKLRVKLVWQNVELAWNWLNLVRVWLANPLDFKNIIKFATRIGELNDEIEATKDELATISQKSLPEFGDELGFLDQPLQDVRIGISNINDEVSTLEGDTRYLSGVYGNYWSKVQSGMEEHGNPVRAVLDGIGSATGNILTRMLEIVAYIPTFITNLRKIKTPDDLREESPSPFEQSLINLGDRMKHLSKMEIPEFTTKLNLVGSANDLVNFRPTPTSALSPSAVNNSTVNNTFNMGGNTVRDDMDLAIINNNIIRTMKQATYGV